MVEAHADLLERAASSFVLAPLPREDLMQEGSFGLCKSVRTFDSSLGVPFPAWAWRLIRQAMIDALDKHQSRVGLEDVVDADALEAEVVIEPPTREPRADYSLEEVIQILESYSELYLRGAATAGSTNASVRKQRPTAGVALVSPRLIDIDRALQRLPPKPYHAVELCDIWGLTLREAAAILDVAFTTVRYRQQNGLAAMVDYLNHGTTLGRPYRAELPFKALFLVDTHPTKQRLAEDLAPAWWGVSPARA